MAGCIKDAAFLKQLGYFREELPFLIVSNLKRRQNPVPGGVFHKIGSNRQGTPERFVQLPVDSGWSGDPDRLDLLPCQHGRVQSVNGLHSRGDQDQT